ncbi:tetratricopeptide repeat protein [Myxococcus stipitatus]|nr:tetratricopeptide repeat protein [Myxococcus stipitatus]
MAEARRRVAHLQALRQIPEALPIGLKGQDANGLDTSLGQLQGFVARADAVQEVASLALDDLRGWHFVTTGSVLLSLSPHGLDAGMNGRYAGLFDSQRGCARGIRLAKAILERLDCLPPRVFALPDRNSFILAKATARVLGVPCEPWPDGGSLEPGLVVAYDLRDVEKPVLVSLGRHRPGQKLWSHLTCWTTPGPVVADFTSVLCQDFFTPWGKRPVSNPETGRLEWAPPDGRPSDALVEELVQLTKEPIPPEEQPELLLSFVGAAATLTNEHGGGLFRSSGERLPQVVESPVRSPRLPLEPKKPPRTPLSKRFPASLHPPATPSLDSTGAIVPASFTDLRDQTLAALASEDANTAFRTIRSVLSYPGMTELRTKAHWSEAWGAFAGVAAVFAGDALAQQVRDIASLPDDAGAYFSLGYELIEQGLHGLAATVLQRAFELAPDSEQIIYEFVAALEHIGAHGQAVLTLCSPPGLVDTRFMACYLLGYNALMTGDLDEPRRRLALLERLRTVPEALPEESSGLDVMMTRLRRFLRRADAARHATSLDLEDLRGWQFVTTGTVLLHLSPHGFDEGMTGRYAFVQDSGVLCLEGLRRVEAVLKHVGVGVPRVFILPERQSAILGLAVAKRLGVPAEPWPEGGSEAPGLVVAYDLADLEGPLLESLHPHRPGQVLWSHLTRWTQESAFAADLTTYLYQSKTTPWGERLKFNAKTRQTERVQPDERPVEELAGELLAVQMDESTLDDLPTLLALVTAVQGLTGDVAPGWARSEGVRHRQLTDSPVKSSQFF